MDIKEDVFRVIVKPNARKSAILGFDEARKAYKIAVSEPAEDNKANKELIRFLSRELGRAVSISSGFSSKIKTIKTR
ncbi:MAG TPA: DUF167 domain-containing protein [Candidatus Nanoarchaeia archaeon]|nr:DUF167 domain-containing protein [Candidatus Nanoarchaeia archaeon]